MNKNILKGIIVLIFVLLVVIGIIFILGNNKGNDTKKPTEDMLTFKEEYEALNGKDNGAGEKYPSISIPEYNLIKYSSVEEIIELAEGGTGIIYFGFPSCPWCRNAVPELITVTLDKGVDIIHYLDLTDLRSIWEIQEGIAVEIKQGKKEYYDLLRVFASIINPYVLTDDDGTEYETGELRIYVPLMVFVKDGEIIGYHNTTVKLPEEQSPWDSLTPSQKEELKDLFRDLIDEMLDKAYCEETCLD